VAGRPQHARGIEGVSPWRRLLSPLLAATLVACVTNDARRAPPAAAPPTVAPLRVTANYPATLLWALDGAAGLPNHARGYEAWLGFQENDPRLASFRERRPKWIERKGNPQDPSLDPFLSCGLETAELAGVATCLRRALPPPDAAIAEDAVAQADAGLRPRWTALAADLNARVEPVRELLRGHAIASAIAALRAAASLPDTAVLASSVVFVANPDPNGSRATLVGTTDVLEIDHRSSPAEQTGIVAHEITHVAVAQSPRTKDVEPALAGHGVAGVIAAAEWNEAFASAFGNGWVVSQLQPGLSDTRSLYGVPIVDALAHGLVRQWAAGARPELGAPLAQQLIAAMRDAPPERWSVADVFARSVAFSGDDSVAAAFQDAASRVWAYRDTPLPADAERPAVAPPLAPMIYFATLDELAVRGSLLGALGLTEDEAKDHVASSPATIYWRESGGVPVVLVVARDAASLRAAASWLAASPHLPPAGWSAAG
jgi:hypothetical protein